MYIFSLWPVALLIHLDPFGVHFPFFGNAGFKISPSLDYNGAKWTSCCVAQKDPLPPKKWRETLQQFLFAEIMTWLLKNIPEPRCEHRLFSFC